MTDDNIIQTSKTVVTTSPTITTSSVQIIGTNPSRIAFYIWNNSANSVYLTFGPTSNASGPTIILATFATYTSNGPVCYIGAISGIRNSGTGNVTIHELIR